MTGPARQAGPAGPQWRRPLIAAAVTVAIVVLVLVIGYERMSDDANSAAGHAPAPQGQTIKPAANGGATASGSRKPVPAGPLAGQRTP